jgi:hypothetical protein
MIGAYRRGPWASSHQQKLGLLIVSFNERMATGDNGTKSKL